MAEEKAAKQASQTGGGDIDKIWNRSFISVCIANTLVSIGLQMSNVMIGTYTNSLGAAATVVGLISGAFAWAGIVFKFFSGPAIDAFNRRNVVIFGTGLIGLAFLGYGITGNVPGLFGSRLVQGAGQAFSTVCFMAMASDCLPRDKTATGLGFYSLAAGIAQMIGPVVSYAIRDAFGYPPVFFAAACVIVIAIIAETQIQLPPREHKKFKLSPGSILAKEALIPACLMVLLSGCYALVNPYLVTYANGQGVGSEISLFFSVYAGFLFLTRPLSGKLADRFGYIIIVPMLGLFAATFLIISVATSLWMFLFAAVLFAFGYGGCQPVINSMAMKLVPQSRRGAGSATNFLGSDLGNIIGPLVGGAIAQNISYQAMWQLMIIPMILGIIVVLACNKTINERVALAAEQA